MYNALDTYGEKTGIELLSRGYRITHPLLQTPMSPLSTSNQSGIGKNTSYIQSYMTFPLIHTPNKKGI